MIDAYNAETAESILPSSVRNPLRQIKWILRDGSWWTRPHDDQFQNTSRFRLGWREVVMPSCMTSGGSWNKTLGDLAQTKEDKYFRNANILGQDSGERLLFKASGCGFCGVASINLFPETRSAVVALSSGTNCGDAADFAALTYIQELFNLKPRVDILAVAQREAAERLKDWDEIVKDLIEHRDTSQPEHDVSEFTGEYCGINMIISIEQDGSTGKLLAFLDRKEDVKLELEYYNVDCYSVLPKSRDDWLVI